MTARGWGMMFRGSRKSQKNDAESHLAQLGEAGYGLSDMCGW